ncbi:hypothetical protein QFC22_001279 [Naganishia vaughanmartiniae]|uniref:Uncharacterized protein n=1 Tax=Naganishia vaughanmartiniae TaxID=1424756 RepID=A0ACC2XI71_9TREE|nr:hypothetical protein QFC22_001279 [Naganishia vaughanmartiniae]
MFKFDFGVVSPTPAFVIAMVTDPAELCLPQENEEGEVTVQNTTLQDDEPVSETSATAAARYRTIQLEELLEKLPPTISFSEMDLPFDTTGCKLFRRDLYDARFQVIDELDDEEENADAKAESARDEQNTAEYVNADTDLIPGTYEGGLKTWEGGMDLVEVLEEQHKKITGGIGSWVKGKRVLEVGCGTGLPSVYLLRRLLELPAGASAITELHLQDYNISVLQLVTLPNLILASISEETLAEMDSNLELTHEVIQEFQEKLKLHNIKLSFSCGDWSGFAEVLQSSDGKKETLYNLVLTAETIYRLESVPSLLRVLKYASRRDDTNAMKAQGGNDTADVASALDGLTLQMAWERDEDVILVAAKILYFGVGGGMQDFTYSVERNQGTVESVRTWSFGVGRQVVRLHW